MKNTSGEIEGVLMSLQTKTSYFSLLDANNRQPLLRTTYVSM